jgi:hypothetical protein
MSAPHVPAPWEAAIKAYHEVLAFLHGPRTEEYLRGWEEARLGKYGLAAAQPSGVAARFLRKDVLKADPIFISPEMLQITYAAMVGFDSTESVEEDDFFIKSGFAYLPEPFYSITSDGGKLAWRAVSWNLDTMWMLDDEDAAVKLQATGATEFSQDDLDEWGVKTAEELIARVTLWADMNDADDFPMPPDVANEIAVLSTHWLPSHMTAIPLSVIPDIRETRAEGDEKAAWLTFLRVLNRVMAEKIISKERRQAPRPYRREAQRRNYPVNDVVVVELRRKTQKAEHENGGGREYSHQWIVEGFWRNQWYPKMGKHRQKYIASYVKGPKDKPLITKGRVWNLDR